MKKQLKYFICLLLAVVAVSAIALHFGAFTEKASAAPAEQYENLTNYYTFDKEELTANEIEGGSGLTNNGVVAATDDERTYAKFEGEAYFALESGFIPGDAITIAMDICSTSRGDFQKVLTYALDFDKYFQIALRTGAENRMNVEVQLTSAGSGEVAVWGYTAFDVFETGKWYSLIVTVDDGYVRMYVDGVIIQERQCPYTLGALLNEAPASLYIGKSIWNDPYFQGGIDELKVFDKCFTPEEVAALAGVPYKAADIKTGLTHYYDFEDEEALGKDNSGNDNSATINGGTTTDGKIGKGLALSGGYVILPANVVSDTNAFSFAAWIYPTDSSEWQKVIDIGAGTYMYMQLALRTGENGAMHIQTSLILDGESHIWGSTAFNSVKLNEWNHVALVVDGNYARVYVNGKVLNNGYFAKSISDFYAAENSQQSAYIGKSQYNDPTLKGVVDEAVFYSRALSSVDVYALAAGETPEKQGGDQPSKPDEPEEADITSGLTHYYSFDNASEPGLDNTGNGNNATVFGETGEGKVGDALLMNGGYVLLPENAVDKDANAFTFAAWVYPTSSGDFQKLFDLGSGMQVFMQIMLRTGSSGKLNVETGLTINGDTGSTKVELWGGMGFDALTLNEWAHVALTVNDKSAKLYVNGFLILSGDFKVSLSEFASQENAQSANYVGKSHFNDPLFMGALDEILIYSRALSDTDITYLAQGNLPEKVVTETEGPEIPDDHDILTGLALQYTFENENLGMDFSGNKGNAVLSSDHIASASSDNGKYIVLSGNKDFMVLPSGVIPKTDSEFTFAAWIYFNSLAEYSRIFDFGQSTVYFDFRIRQNGVLETTVTTNNTAGESKVSTVENAVKLNEWMHVALTVSGDSVLIYVNGTIVGAGHFNRTLCSLYESAHSMKQNYIGLSRYGQDPYLNAYMDDMLVYYRALSANDIKALYSGMNVSVEGAETDDKLLINGRKERLDLILTVAEEMKLEGDVLFTQDGMTAATLKAQLGLAEGTTAVVADKYDFAVSDAAAVCDGYYLKLYHNGLIANRVRICTGNYHKVSFDTDGGEALGDIYVTDGATVRLPYVVKDGYELTGYGSGLKAGDSVVVSADMLFTAEYEERDVTVTVDMRNGTYRKITGRAGETVELDNFGNEKITGIRINGTFCPLGELILPNKSVVATVAFLMVDAEGETIDYTVYSGAFYENEDNNMVSSEAYSLATINGAEINSGVIEMKITAKSANDCGIIFWVNDGGRSGFWENTPAQYHVALLNWEGWLLIGKINYNGTTWNCVKDYKIPSFSVDHEYVMKVVLEDKNIKVYLDGTLYLEYFENDEPAGNGVGFRCAAAGVSVEVVSLKKEVQ